MFQQDVNTSKSHIALFVSSHAPPDSNCTAFIQLCVCRYLPVYVALCYFHWFNYDQTFDFLYITETKQGHIGCTKYPLITPGPISLTLVYREMSYESEVDRRNVAHITHRVPLGQ